METVTEPCPTCGHPRELCALCRGTGRVVETKQYGQPGSRNYGMSAMSKPCPNGCPGPIAMLA